MGEPLTGAHIRLAVEKLRKLNVPTVDDSVDFVGMMASYYDAKFITSDRLYDIPTDPEWKVKFEKEINDAIH